MTEKLPTFVFIAGHHKSGTSHVHNIIREHKDIEGFSNSGAWFDEGQHLQKIYPNDRQVGGPGKYIFNSRSYMNETHRLATKEVSEKLIQQWSNYCNFNSNFFVEKSPPNLIRTRFLQALFPNSKFIIILRHPLAVACATHKGFAKDVTIRYLIDHTLTGYEIAMNDLLHLKHAMIVRYEEIVSNTQQITDQLFNFIGVTPLASKSKTVNNINDKYFTVWKQQYQSQCGDIQDLEIRANRLNYSLYV